MFLGPGAVWPTAVVGDPKNPCIDSGVGPAPVADSSILPSRDSDSMEPSFLARVTLGFCASRGLTPLLPLRRPVLTFVVGGLLAAVIDMGETRLFRLRPVERLFGRCDD